MQERPPDTYFQNERRDLLPYIPRKGNRLVDIGCGEGFFALMLKREMGYSETWGMELDIKSATAAASRLDKVIHGDVVSKIDELPDGYFHLACMNDVLEHLMWPEDFLKQLRRKLTADAHIFCSVPNIREFHLLWDLLMHQDFEYTEQGLLDRTHIRFFTKRTFLSLLRRAGYEPISVVGTGRTKSWRFKFLNAMTLWRGEDMRHSHFYILARPV